MRTSIAAQTASQSQWGLTGHERDSCRHRVERKTAMHPAELPIPELLKECDVIHTRRSGPGGQHRNKVETAVVLTHRPSGLKAEASERRSQSENLEVATGRMRRTLAVSLRTYRPIENAPSALWKSRLRGTRIEINAEHADFPAVLAESLDLLAQADWNAPELASRMGTTLSQLVKFWKKEPAALIRVNAERARRGFGRLE